MNNSAAVTHNVNQKLDSCSVDIQASFHALLVAMEDFKPVHTASVLHNLQDILDNVTIISDAISHFDGLIARFRQVVMIRTFTVVVNPYTQQEEEEMIRREAADKMEAAMTKVLPPTTPTRRVEPTLCPSAPKKKGKYVPEQNKFAVLASSDSDTLTMSSPEVPAKNERRACRAATPTCCAPPTPTLVRVDRNCCFDSDCCCGLTDCQWDNMTEKEQEKVIDNHCPFYVGVRTISEEITPPLSPEMNSADEEGIYRFVHEEGIYRFVREPEATEVPDAINLDDYDQYGLPLWTPSSFSLF